MSISKDKYTYFKLYREDHDVSAVLCVNLVKSMDYILGERIVSGGLSMDWKEREINQECCCWNFNSQYNELSFSDGIYSVVAEVMTERTQWRLVLKMKRTLWRYIAVHLAVIEQFECHVFTVFTESIWIIRLTVVDNWNEMNIHGISRMVYHQPTREREETHSAFPFSEDLYSVNGCWEKERQFVWWCSFWWTDHSPLDF